MSYQEELLIRIRSAYEAGGFSSLSADLSKAKSGYTQVGNSSSEVTTQMRKAEEAVRQFNTGSANATKQITGGLTPAMRGLDVSHLQRMGVELNTSTTNTGRLNTAMEKVKGTMSNVSNIAVMLGSIIGAYTLHLLVSSAIEAEKAWTRVFSNTNLLGNENIQIQKQIKQQVFDTAQTWGVSTSELRAGIDVIAAKYGDINKAMSYSNGLAATSLLQNTDAASVAEALFKADEGNLKTLKTKVLTLDQYNRYAADGVLTQEEIGQILKENELRAQGMTDTDAANIQRMENSVNKLKTSLGSIIAGPLGSMTGYVQSAADWFNNLDGTSKNFLGTVGLLGVGFVALAPFLKPSADMLSGMVGYAKDLYDKIPSTKTTTIKCVKDPSCTGTTSTSSTTTQPSPVKSALLNISSLLIIATAAVAGGSALKFMNDALGGTHQQLMNILNLSGGATGTSMGGLFGAMLMGEGVSLVDILQQGIPIIGIMITSFTTIKGIATGLYGALSGPFQNAYMSIVSWWGGLPAWFGGLSAGIGKQWDDVVNYFNDKGTIGGQVYDGLKKIYCIIVGCSPGIIPALQMLYLYALFVFNAMLSPVMTVRNTIQAFVLYIMLRMALLQNDIITKWNLITAIVGVWINTGIAVVTDGINWAIVLWNQATGTISVWVGTGVSVATNAIDTAWAYWQRLKDFVKDPITGIINIVTQAASAGSPTEVDYLYGQGSLYESDYTPIVTTTSATAATVTSTTSSKIVISEGAVKVEVGSIDSTERVKEVENAITVALSDLNDSKGR